MENPDNLQIKYEIQRQMELRKIQKQKEHAAEGKTRPAFSADVDSAIKKIDELTESIKKLGE